MNILISVILFIFLFSCEKTEKLVYLTGTTMGTSYNVKFIRNSTITISNEEIKKFIDLRLKKVNLSMSTFLPESELSRFNKSTVNTWFSISKDLSEVLQFSLDLAASTNGYYDPTVGPLVNLWGFGPITMHNFPDARSIKETLKAVGYKKLKFKTINSNKNKLMQISKNISSLYLDLSSSAKGFGVDKVAQLLEKLTISNYLVEIGGELVTKGKNNGDFWTVGIEFPNNLNPEKSIIKKIKSKNYGVATSGNYRNFFKKNGKMYSHIISTRTGRPIFNTLLSVTVVYKNSCMKADGIATALMVMGRIKAIEYADTHKIAAFLIYNDSKKSGVLGTHYTKAFHQLDLL